VCAGCDVRTLCLALGIGRDEWGVWGGVLLENGKPIEKVKLRGRPKKSTAA
jgi:WhiB family transcriptional regulator, redox-sensing transcriptional regulator